MKRVAIALLLGRIENTAALAYPASDDDDLLNLRIQIRGKTRILEMVEFAELEVSTHSGQEGQATLIHGFEEYRKRTRSLRVSQDESVSHCRVTWKFRLPKERDSQLLLPYGFPSMREGQCRVTGEHSVEIYPPYTIQSHELWILESAFDTENPRLQQIEFLYLFVSAFDPDRTDRRYPEISYIALREETRIGPEIRKILIVHETGQSPQLELTIYRNGVTRRRIWHDWEELMDVAETPDTEPFRIFIE